MMPRRHYFLAENVIKARDVRQPIRILLQLRQYIYDVIVIVVQQALLYALQVQVELPQVVRGLWRSQFICKIIHDLTLVHKIS